MTHNRTTLPEVSVATEPFEPPKDVGKLDRALAKWERQWLENERWSLCFWDGIYRKPSAIRALIIVP